MRQNFQAAQFSQIAISKHFTETIFADQEFRVYGFVKFCELNFRGLLKSAKTAKITRLENLDIYGMLSANRESGQSVHCSAQIVDSGFGQQSIDYLRKLAESSHQATCLYKTCIVHFATIVALFKLQNL